MTGTYVLWVAQDGTDVGTFAVGVLSGVEALLVIVAIILGQVLALKIWP